MNVHAIRKAVAKSNQEISQMASKVVKESAEQVSKNADNVVAHVDDVIPANIAAKLPDAGVANDIPADINAKLLDQELASASSGRSHRAKSSEIQESLQRRKSSSPVVTTEIPTESNIRQQAQNIPNERNILQRGWDGFNKNTKHLQRIGAGVGVGAILISNMNKSKGQQSNSQLYGQQTPYSY